MNKLLLSVPEAAERLSIGVSKFRQLVASGQIESVRVGRAIRIPATALEQFAETLRIPTSEWASSRPCGRRDRS